MEKLCHVKQFNDQNLKPIPLSRIKHDTYTDSLAYQIHETETGLLLDFIQTITTDYNKWQQPNVVSDKILYRFSFIKDLLEMGFDKNKLIDYIENHYTQAKIETKGSFDFGLIKRLSQDSKCLQVSLPYGIKIPTEPRKFKTTFLPVNVVLNGYNYSHIFEDYDQFGPKIVNQVFSSIVENQVPELNHDLFNAQQDTAIAEKL